MTPNMLTDDETAILTHIKDSSCLPTYASKQASGADVKAYLSNPVTIHPGKRALISTGLSMEIPPGYEIQIRPRSGLALKHGVTVLNSPGTIDADYRGEIGVILMNLGEEDFIVTPGMRIAQIVLAKVEKGRFKPTQEPLSETKRGDGGFGHSGTH